MWVENFLKREGTAWYWEGWGCIPEGGRGRECGLKGTLKKRPVSTSGEFSRAHGLRILVSMS